MTADLSADVSSLEKTSGLNPPPLSSLYDSFWPRRTGGYDASVCREISKNSEANLSLSKLQIIFQAKRESLSELF